MKLSFDRFERYELPQVTLCNPNSRATEVDGKITITDTVGVLSNPKGMNLKLNFNAPHELSFDYYRHKSSDPIKQSFYDKIYEAIQTDRYVYLTDIGYFIISNVSDSDEDNIDKKSISLKSCEENEFAVAEGLYLKEGTYYLHTNNNDGLLDLFLPKTAGWTMGYIDPSLLTKPYYVEKTEVDNGYNFLYATIQDMFECIVEPDIIRRTVSVYSRVYYAEHHLTDIHIAKYNLLKHKTVEENDEDKYTALNVQGKDENLEIRAVNPTGKNVIYNFEPRYSWMSPALQQAIEKWQEKCESVEEEYLTLQQGYYEALQTAFNMQKDIDVLKNELKLLEQSRDQILLTEDSDEKTNALTNTYTLISNKQAEINTAEKEYDEYEKLTLHNKYSLPISQINDACALDTTAKDINGNTIFTIDLINELMTHIKPTDYVDEYMLVTESMTYPERFEKAKELMDRAQSQLVKISSGQKTYSIDTRSFLFNKQFRHFSEQLCAGAIIYVETKKDTMEQLHLTGIDINFDDKSTNFTLGNKYDRSDLKALYEDVLGQNSKSFSELKYIASIVEEQQKYYKRDWAAELRTLTLDNILTSEDQAIEINNHGLIGRKRQLNEDGSWKTDENGNPLFDPEQVKLINNTLVFTDKNWQNATTAVGKIAVGYDSNGNVKYAYGINGQVLIGELILGNNLVLTGTGAGIKIKDSNGNNVFYADDEGTLTLSGNIIASGGNIAGWNINSNSLEKFQYSDDDKLYWISLMSPTKVGSWGMGTDVFVFRGFAGSSWSDNYTDYFRLNSDGTLFTMKLNATGGTIGSFILDEDYLQSKDRTIGIAVNKSNNGQFAFWAGGNSIETTKFRVDHAGNLFATNANITGTIIADDGTVGGWTIKNNWIGASGELDYYGNGVYYTYGAGLYAGAAGTKNTCLAIGYMPNSIAGSWDNAEFRVTGDGKLYATGANITGTINAGSIIAEGTYVGNGNGTGLQFGIGQENAMALKYGSGSSYREMSLSRVGGAQLYARLPYGTNSYQAATIYVGSSAFYDQGYGIALSPGSNVNGLLIGTWNIGNTTAATAVTSDMNLKNTIEKIDLKYEKFYDSIQPVTYKYNDSESDRTHTGYISQQIGEALEDNDLTNKDFAGIVITNIDSESTEDQTWCIRYDEFVALNTWQIQKAKARITELENTVAELKTQIQTLTAG